MTTTLTCPDQGFGQGEGGQRDRPQKIEESYRPLEWLFGLIAARGPPGAGRA
jgi:hypothetical protein